MINTKNKLHYSNKNTSTKWWGNLIFALMIITTSLSLAKQVKAGTIRDDRPDSDYTDLANEPQFQSVGGFSGLNAVYIGDNWALTAAHVNGSFFTIGGITYGITNQITHPNWTGDFTNGFDLKLLELNGTPAMNGVQPALIYDGIFELGQIGTFVGQGVTGTGLTGGMPGTFGTQRAGTNVIDVFGTNSGMPNMLAIGLDPTDPSNNILLSDFDSPALNANSLSPFSSPVPTNLEYSIADRDSGGGTFMNFGGQWRLVGIHSFIGSNGIGSGNGDYGTILADTRVSVHTAWIESVSGISATPVPFHFNASYGLVALGIMAGSYHLLGLLRKGELGKGLGKVVEKLPKP